MSANSPAVLLLHQFGSNRESCSDFALRWQKDDLSMLTIERRGFGDSTKTTDGKTVTAERTDEAVKVLKADVAKAFDFLAKQKNVNSARMGIVSEFTEAA